MSRENKFAADLYAYLRPWMDHGNPVGFLTDEAQRNDEAKPDLFFNFAGNSTQFRIEVKVIKSSGSVKVTSKQAATWHQDDSTDAPHIWVCIAEDTDVYYLWPNDDFVKALQDASAEVAPYLTVQAPATKTKCANFNLLVAEIIAFAKAANKLN